MHNLTDAETRASKATSREPFSANLLNIRRGVQQILSLFGRSEIFAQYTVHDFSHVNEMLEGLEWLIPDTTKAILSDAEWLLIVLSIYFHDLGLVVTDQEYRSRNHSILDEFYNNELFSGPSGDDYKAKVFALGQEEAQRFLYQEFVRHNHAKRIRAWIENRSIPELGAASSSIEEINSLLTNLDPEFRRDLALICESHNLDDIDDLSKYKLSKAYGNSEQETANLQYCAVILRTSDLIQFHRQRAPSTLYRLINPTDPISQREWAKQNAVRRIRAKPGVDREGNVSPTAAKDTIEVTAKFTNDSGYFGLTSYLRYVRAQLGQSYSAIDKSKKLLERTYNFPWRYIDDSNVEAEGFIPKTYGFELDQARILDLLTGHTLYNDSSIVIRELIQNSIDAVRLQAYIDQGDSTKDGLITIKWDTEKAELQVEDNGTGMTQAIIENHLLKVGASRYQDPKFIEQFHNFSSISRFGIGVLSSFMVADSVEIVTCSLDEPQARQISLRSVHGRYLIRLLDKRTSPEVARIGPHGTLFKLKFRASAKRIDVYETVRRFVYFPRCSVKVIVDNADAVNVGYASPRHALEEYLKSKPSFVGVPGQTVVREGQVPGVDLAYALRYDKHFGDWNLIAIPDFERRREFAGEDSKWVPVGTCVEGIAVEPWTPGFTSRRFLSVVNYTGNAAPKTNVARTLVEDTPQRTAVLESVYGLYTEYVKNEVTRLQTTENYSLTYATEQIPFLASALVSGRPGDISASEQILKELPIFLVEDGDKRFTMTTAELEKVGQFTLAESQFLSSINELIKQSPRNVTTAGVFSQNNTDEARLPHGQCITNTFDNNLVRSAIWSKFEVIEIHGFERARRLDSKWSKKADCWFSKSDADFILRRYGGRETAVLRQIFERSPSRHLEINVPTKLVRVAGLEEHLAATIMGEMYLLPNTGIVKLLDELWQSARGSLRDALRLVVYLAALVETLSYRSSDPSLALSNLDRNIRRVEAALSVDVGKGELMEAFEACRSNARVFDPFSWTQRTPEPEF